MHLKIVDVDKKRSHIRENGIRVIFFELSGEPDDNWISHFNYYYGSDPNQYKGRASIMDNKYVKVTTDYHYINQVKDCVTSAVHNANNEYRKMLNEKKIEQEHRDRKFKEQTEKREQEYKNFKNQLDNLKFDD
jgi:hypothetical protein